MFIGLFRQNDLKKWVYRMFNPCVNQDNTGFYFITSEYQNIRGLRDIGESKYQWTRASKYKSIRGLEY